MSCKYKGKCPSATGWCESKERDYSRCIPFLLSAYENAKGPNVLYECDRRACDRCNPECHHTNNIRHAKNFQLSPISGEVLFVEVEGD